MAISDEQVQATLNAMIDQLTALAEQVEAATKDDPGTPQNEGRIDSGEGMMIAAAAFNIALFVQTTFQRDKADMASYVNALRRVDVTIQPA